MTRLRGARSVKNGEEAHCGLHSQQDNFVSFLKLFGCARS